jgi:F-type H+-transporting ATPase subunit b
LRNLSIRNNYINTLLNLTDNSGFGINTNLLETNIINLSVVVIVLIYFGKDILLEILKERKESILKDLQEADIKFQEANERLRNAQLKFDLASIKVDEFRSQGLLNASQISNILLDQVEEDIKRLDDSKLVTIRLEEEKVVAEICEKAASLALNHVNTLLAPGLDPVLQNQIMKRSLVLLRDIPIN